MMLKRLLFQRKKGMYFLQEASVFMLVLRPCPTLFPTSGSLDFLLNYGTLGEATCASC